MQTYTIFTDPHLGTRRAAHTTRDSSKRLTEALYRQARAIVVNHPRPICAGDLFDRAFNDEATLVQGYNIAGMCEFTLAGNHDETNREGSVPSLRALSQMGVPVIAAQGFSTPQFYEWADGIYAVPHHASQELFELAMAMAGAHAAENHEGRPTVLILHCNYDCAFATDDDTLNLSTGVAEALLEHFDLILLGHEHKPATHFDGRVVILGNTHPTSFADISDKFVYTLHIGDADLKLEKECIWSAAAQHATIRFGDYEGLSALGAVLSAEFIDVIGTAGAEQAVEVAEFIQAVWNTVPDAFAVRNSVQIGDGLIAVELAEAPKLVDLKSRIADDLEGSDLQDLYKELLKECEA